MERPRKGVGKNQELRGLPRQDLTHVIAPVSLECGRGPQHRLPLCGVECATDVGRTGKEDVVFDVEDAGRLVGAFDVLAELDELPAFAARISGSGETLEQM